jgi:hypothetical protein
MQLIAASTGTRSRRSPTSSRTLQVHGGGRETVVSWPAGRRFVNQWGERFEETGWVEIIVVDTGIEYSDKLEKIFN